MKRLIPVLIFVVLGCTSNGPEDIQHSGIVKKLGAIEFIYNEELLVTEFKSTDGQIGVWWKVEIQYDSLYRVTRYIVWYDVDQHFNITYEYQSNDLQKSYDQPIDAFDRLTVATYLEVTNQKIFQHVDSFLKTLLLKSLQEKHIFLRQKNLIHYC